MLTTERLTLRVLSDNEMREVIAKEPTEEMKIAYGEMLDGAIKHPAEREWYAIWLAALHDGTTVGNLCFKGLGVDGAVEIGYGILPLFQGNGYATEAVIALCDWAAAQPKVTRIEAETEPCNTASQRVLAKAGFIPNGVMGEEGPRFVRI